MNRRDLLAAGAGLTLTESSFCLASSLQASGERNRASDRGTVRYSVIVRSGFTRKPNGADDRAPSPSGMFDTEVVRASRSSCFRQVTIIPIEVRRFTFITNRMSGSM